MMCYRHPNRETYVSCSNCLRPICTDCMVQTAVGIKCPECAGVPTGVKKATTGARRAVGVGTGAIVTKTLIGLNVLVFLTQIAGGDLTRLQSEAYVNGVLYGPLVAQGDWWRLVTAGFLHGSLVHIFFNMLMLWWFGRPLEELLGRGRFIAVYLIAVLAGSAGALLLSSDVPTLGASGGVFGILGAGLILERRGVMVFGGAALPIVVVNLDPRIRDRERLDRRPHRRPHRRDPGDHRPRRPGRTRRVHEDRRDPGGRPGSDRRGQPAGLVPGRRAVHVAGFLRSPGGPPCCTPWFRPYRRNSHPWDTGSCPMCDG